MLRNRLKYIKEVVGFQAMATNELQLSNILSWMCLFGDWDEAKEFILNDPCGRDAVSRATVNTIKRIKAKRKAEADCLTQDAETYRKIMRLQDIGVYFVDAQSTFFVPEDSVSKANHIIRYYIKSDGRFPNELKMLHADELPLRHISDAQDHMLGVMPFILRCFPEGEQKKQLFDPLITAVLFEYMMEYDDDDVPMCHTHQDDVSKCSDKHM